MQEDNNEQMEIIVARVDSLEIKFNKLIKDTIKWKHNVSSTGLPLDFSVR